jgi:hypothetical protein
VCFQTFTMRFLLCFMGKTQRHLSELCNMLGNEVAKGIKVSL